MKPIRYLGPTGIGLHRTKSSRHEYLALGFMHPWYNVECWDD